VTQPRSALNLRLVLAVAGVVGWTALAVGMFWAGIPVVGWLAVAVALLAVVNVVIVQYRRMQRHRREPGAHHSLFE
jgi:CHASE2 domain-containing sensor protein